MKKFYIYILKFRVHVLIKVIECKTKEEAYNRYSYLNECVCTSLEVRTRLMHGIDVENGEYENE